MIILLCEVKEWVSDSGVVKDKLMVEVGKAKEGTYFLDFGGGWPGGNAVEFHWVHGELTGFYDHSEVFDFGDIKLAFLKLQVEVELSHALEDTMSSFCVGLGIRGGNEEVIYIDDKPSFSNHVPEGVIHESLERCGGVTKAEEHDRWFEEPFVGDEGHLPLVTVFDADVVVPPTNVKFGEVASIFQLVHEVRDKGKGVGVAGGVFVEISVVLAGAELTVLLFDKEEGRHLGGVRRTNLSCG